MRASGKTSEARSWSVFPSLIYSQYEFHHVLTFGRVVLQRSSYDTEYFELLSSLRHLHGLDMRFINIKGNRTFRF